MKRIVTAKIILVLIFTAVLGLFAMPNDWKQKIPFNSVREYLMSKNIKLGLDLAGGRQLDWKIDLSKVEERNSDDDSNNDVSSDAIVQGVAETLRRRIDPDGTRELVIQTSQYANEQHVIVELTSDIDNEETRAKLQKQIDLQFKEQKTEAEEEEKVATKKLAEDSLITLQTAEDFKIAAQKIDEDNDSVEFKEESKFKNLLLDQKVAEKIWDAAPGTLVSEVFDTTGGYMYDPSSGSITPINGFAIFKVIEKKQAEREISVPGEEFDVVQGEVNEATDKTIKVADLPKAIMEVVQPTQQGQMTEVLETDTQYSIYKVLPLGEGETYLMANQIVVNKSTEGAKEKIDAAYARLQSTTTKEMQDQLTYQELFFSTSVDPWKETELTGQYFKVAKISQDQLGFPIVTIEFDTDGAKLFEQITERNIGKPIAIFVGGDFISAPNVNEKISGGNAQITFGTKNFIEAKKEAIALSRDLNAGAIPAPISLAGEVKVEASLGAEALNVSVYAGILGLIILAVYMVSFYRLLGLIAVVALSIYSIILISILKSTSIFVLTLAGVAGIVLSIGMAVDANILIFERMREELRDGKNFSAALEIGFERAWTSIRDSNVSSLITCTILYWFGTSIIKGFAVMLALGILISMFTAITITKTFLSGFVGTKMSGKTGLFIKK